jgi:hypothetical protein
MVVVCLTCHEPFEPLRRTRAGFKEFCSENCYQGSDEYKFLNGRMDDFLAGLSPLQVAYLDLFITSDEYHFRRFVSKVRLLCV